MGVRVTVGFIVYASRPPACYIVPAYPISAKGAEMCSTMRIDLYPHKVDAEMPIIAPKM